MAQPLMELHTSFGDKLKFRSMTASEELGRLYEFSVVAMAKPEDKIKLADLLGKPAAVSIELSGGGRRYFHGLVANAALEGASGGLLRLRLSLRPWLWMLTRRADNRIFQAMKIDAIIKKVFEKYTGDVSFELSGSYPTYEYCVQYRETDFNFVSRLIEAEGIYYYFRHKADKETLVFCDKMSAHTEYPGHATLKYRESHDNLIDLQAIGDWRHRYEMPPGKVALTDYDFLDPAKALMVNVAGVHNTPASSLDVYDYPGDYIAKGEGDRYAHIRMEEFESRYQRVSGATPSVRGLAAGYLFKLEDHPMLEENQQYLVVSTHIEMQYAGYESGGGDTHFNCRFTAIPNSEVWRSERTTPKPIVPGPQTAVVVGPAGEEIYTDQYGRVKVHFHWDRLDKKDENSSCWLRVATTLAGKAFGAISLPRIGQEVVVDFLEGDPDRPLVTSRVYNANQVTPYKLPDHKTVTTLKTLSSKGGAAANFNELLFEDLKGSELIRLHAEKDLIEIVKNDAHLSVGNDQFRKVKRDLKEEIGRHMHCKVVENRNEEVGGNLGVTVGGNTALDTGGDLGMNAGGNASLKAGQQVSVESGTSTDVKIGTNLGMDAGANVHIKAGANLVIEAGAMLTLKGAMINIEASGIVSINGSLTKINSGGGGGSGGGASPKSPASPKKPEKPEKLDKDIKAIADKLAVGR